MASQAEINVIRRLVKPGDTVIEVGAGRDDWIRDVLTPAPDSPPLAIGNEEAYRLDALCAERGIRHIHLLKINGQDERRGVIRGAAGLLRRARINIIRFDHGGTHPDAPAELEWMFTSLSDQGYVLYQTGETPRGPLTWETSLGQEEATCFLAVNRRLLGLFRGDKPSMLDTAGLLAQYGIQPAAVLHVGAHLGKEAVHYLERGVSRVLLVEANPDLAAELLRRFSDRPEVEVAACAAGDRNGTATLRVTSNDQSSSILPLHRHLTFYPGITEARQVEVEVARLDDIIRRHGWQPADIDFLNMDIQGAEHLALAGAPDILRHVRAVNIEVNFEELYAGCAQIEQVEEILGAAGLRRVAMTCPYHPSWGDAFYIR